MRKKRSPVRKVQPPKVARAPSTPIDVDPLHIGFPLTLHHKAENKLCFFRDEIHMKKYIDRCKLTSKDYKVTETKPKET